MPHHIHPLESCLTRILVKDTELQPVPSGAGVALHGGRVLTCAHVVNAALRLPNSSKEKPEVIITVDFPLSGSKEKVMTKVGFWDYETDLAELIIIESLPSEVTPVYLHTQDELWDHRVQVFGFPSKNLDGAWADCQLRGHNTIGWVEIYDPNTTGNFIQQGFSGGPVWDSTSECVIGIIVAVDKNTDARIGYLIPAQKIAEKWLDMPKQNKVKTTQELKITNPSTRLLKVFLCHSSTDKPIVRELYKKLLENGVDAWLDEKKLLPGQKWDIEIQKAIRETDVVIICVSKTSITKEGYVQKEIKFSLDLALEKPEGTIFLIPIRLDDCKMLDRLLPYHYVDYFGDKVAKGNSFDSILASLKHRAKTLSIDTVESRDNKQFIPSTYDDLWGGTLEPEFKRSKSSDGISANIGLPFQWTAEELLGKNWVSTSGGNRFYLLQLAFNLRSRGKMRAIAAEFSLILSPQDGKYPIIFDAFPREQLVGSNSNVTLGIGPDLKFETREPSLAKAEATLDLGVIIPYVRVTGLQESKVVWSFIEHPKYPLSGSRSMVALVSLPPGMKTTLATLELNVTAESRFGPIRFSPPVPTQGKLRLIIGEK